MHQNASPIRLHGVVIDSVTELTGGVHESDTPLALRVLSVVITLINRRCHQYSPMVSMSRMLVGNPQPGGQVAHRQSRPLVLQPT